ncbi:GNAT family N-acyltransferase [Xylophilus sp. GW821-FHT01B05]
MPELPVPTLPLSPVAAWSPQPLRAFAASLRGVPPTREALLPRLPQPVADMAPQRGELHVAWAQHLDEVREAQRLRYAVFAGEMGARLPVPADPKLAGHDIDLFDPYCEHLLVRDGEGGPVIGTYRVLTPAQARRIGSTYSDTEFDLVRLRSMRENMVELGRSCVHPEHRHGGVILALWGALAQFMMRNRLDIMLGCASIPMLQHGVPSPQLAAGIWHRLRRTHLAPPELQVWPRLALPVDEWEDLEGSRTDLPPVEPPPLIMAYLRLGARILGAPAWDPDFNTADLPMLMRLADMPARYRRHLLAGA